MITGYERQMILQNALAVEVGQGNRVAWVGDGVAHVYRMPAPVNHVVHAIMTLFTFGLWLPIWFLCAVFQPKPKLFGIAVNDFGVPYYFDVSEAHRQAFAAEQMRRRGREAQARINGYRAQLH